MRDLLTTVGELAGAAAIAIGFGMICLPAGLIVGGALAVAFSYLAARR